VKIRAENNSGGAAVNASMLVPLIITGVLILAALVATAVFFMRIPIAGTTLALDWIGIRVGVAGWNILYGAESALRIPPWSALLLVPIGLLPLQAGWGVVAFLTFLIVPFSLPWERLHGWKIVLAALALTLGFPVLRTIVDGNIEFLIVAGLLLLEYGILRGQPVIFALGILLSATKVQETWVLLIFLPLVAGRGWTVRRWLEALGVAALIALPCLIWKGRDWIASVVTSQYRGSIMDSSLMTTVERVGLPAGAAAVFWVILFLLTALVAAKYCRGYSREAVAFFLSASLLLAPYSAGNNLIVVYVIGAVPLLLARRWEGVLLFGLINLMYFFLPFRDLLYWWSASYWTLVLMISWTLFAIRMRTLKREADAGKNTIASDGAPIEPLGSRNIGAG
jgi:uncharacterized membrane protein